ERGDLVRPWVAQDKRIAPRPNAADVVGRIVQAVNRSLTEFGEAHEVFIDRGEADGVQEGNTFAVVRQGDGLSNAMVVGSYADGAGGASPDVVAACALGAVPGVGATTLARIAARFESLRQALEEGPTALMRDGDALKLTPEARAYLAQGPDLHHLGAYALEAA